MTGERVAVFWDLENCRNFSGIPGQKIITNIRNAAHAYGRITSFRAYVEVTLVGAPLRSLFQSSGVSIIDCPHNGKKEVADRMMLVDVMAYAMDNSPPSTIILITGDRDFAYLISVLALRQYQTVVIVPPNYHSSLTYQASVVLDWDTQILQKQSTTGLTDSAAVLSTQSSSISQLVNTNLLFPPASCKGAEDLGALKKHSLVSTSSHQASEPSVGVLKQPAIDSFGSDESDKSSRFTATESADSTPASAPTLTKKQIRLAKKELRNKPETTHPSGVIASTTGAQANGNILQWGESSVVVPLQTSLDSSIKSTYQWPPTSTWTMPAMKLETNVDMTPTSRIPFESFKEKSWDNPSTILQYQCITAMPAYRGLSVEELRAIVYQEGCTKADVSSNIS